MTGFFFLNLFYRRPTVIFIENYHLSFSEVPEGIQHFSGGGGGGGGGGGQLFPAGVQLLISYRNQYNL